MLCMRVRRHGSLLRCWLVCEQRLLKPCDGSGVNPYLACSVAAPKIVDPEWAPLSSRIRLFRLLWKDFPEYRPVLIARLANPDRRYRARTDHLVRLLHAWGWDCVDGAVFQDSAGRRFSLVSSSLCHILSLLM